MAKDTKRPEQSIQPIQPPQVARLQLGEASIATIRSPEWKYIYANNVAVSPSTFDVTLVFSQVRDAGEGKGLINEEQVSIVVSPHHFKILSQHIERAVKQYEELNGPINIVDQVPPIPTDAVPKLKALIEDMRKRTIEAMQATVKPIDVASSSQPPPPAKRSRGAQKKKGS